MKKLAALGVLNTFIGVAGAPETMETIQLTIDESLLAEVQRATTALHMTPSDFMRVALERALEQREIIAKERQDAEGYAKHPQSLEEVEEWESEQDWE